MKPGDLVVIRPSWNAVLSYREDGSQGHVIKRDEVALFVSGAGELNDDLILFKGELLLISPDILVEAER